MVTGKEVILMTGLESFWHSFWWVFPLILMVLCCFGMRRRGAGMCGFHSRGTDTLDIHSTDSAIDILDKRYALGEIPREEYEERKRTIG
jgi:uncharacterized membrane protein